MAYHPAIHHATHYEGLGREEYAGVGGGNVYFSFGHKYAYISRAAERQLLEEVGFDDADPVEKIAYSCSEDLKAKWTRRMLDHLGHLARDHPREFEQRFVVFDFRGDEAKRELLSILTDFCSIASTRAIVWKLLDPREPISVLIATTERKDLQDDLANIGYPVGSLLILRADVRSILGHTRPVCWAPIMRPLVKRVYGRLDEFTIEMGIHMLTFSCTNGVVVLDPICKAIGWRPGAELLYIPDKGENR